MERSEAGLKFRIVRGCGQEYADATHALGCCARAASGHTPPRRREHREIPAASCPLLGSGDGIVSAQTSALIGAETASLLQHECWPMSAMGQTLTFGDVGPMSGFPGSGHGWVIYEYTPQYCKNFKPIRSPGRDFTAHVHGG